MAEIAGTKVPYIKDDETIRQRFENGWDEHGMFEAIKSVADDPVNATFWDIGACVGVHSMFAAQHYENVIAFEPVMTNVASMTDNVSINGEFDTIDIRKEAVADREGAHTIEIRESSDAGHGRHSLSSEGNYEVLTTDTVTAHTGNKIAAMEGIPNVVKIDVEGAEGLVLDGMDEVLEHHDLRHVFIETHDPNPVQPSYEDFGYTLDEIYHLLLDAGFSIETLDRPYLIWAHR
jgi:FkbM family methyltransferase